MEPRRPRLGELLLADRMINETQLALALGNQARLGGRIGTNLVELDLLSILELGAALASQCGVPEADPRAFMAASPRLLDQFPRELAARLSVFPIRVENKVLQLAMVDPQSPEQISEVTFNTGLRVAPLVSPELRMVFFLEQRLGVPRPPRFRTASSPGYPAPPGSSRDPTGPAHPGVGGPAAPVAGSGPLSRSPTRPGYQAVPAAVAPPAAVVRAKRPLPDEDPDLIYLDDVPRHLVAEDDDFEVTVDDHGDAPVAAGGGGPLPEGLTAVRAALERARDRAAVAALAVCPVLEGPALSVLFRIKTGLASALAAAPSHLSPAEIQRLELPLSPGSLLQHALVSSAPVRGPASLDPLQKVISVYLRAPEPGEICVVPVVVGQRVAGLLCVQLPLGSRGSEDALGRLSTLTGSVAAAYLRLIRDAKQRPAG